MLHGTVHLPAFASCMEVAGVFLHSLAQPSGRLFTPAPLIPALPPAHEQGMGPQFWAAGTVFQKYQSSGLPKVAWQAFFLEFWSGFAFPILVCTSCNGRSKVGQGVCQFWPCT